MRTLFPVAESFAHYGQKKATLTNLNSNLVNSQCWKLPQLLLFQSWWFLSFSTGEFIFVLTTSGNQLFKLFGREPLKICGERNLCNIQSCGSSDLPTRIHPHLRSRSSIFMIRAARHSSRHRIRFLLDQILFYYRLKLLML